MVTGHFFRHIVCAGCGAQLDVPIYCGDRFCEVCSITRLLRVRHRLEFITSNANLPKGYVFKHLTLTISSEQNLVDMIHHIIKSFQRLRSRKLWKDKVDGGAYVIEITGRPGMWHAHIHACISAKWISWDKLVLAWRKCSGSRGVFIVDVPRNELVRYLTKYLTKPVIPDLVLEKIVESLKGIRLFAPIGSWFNLMKKYVKPKSPCRVCGSLKWFDADIEAGNYHACHWKSIRLPEELQPNSS